MQIPRASIPWATKTMCPKPCLSLKWVLFIDSFTKSSLTQQCRLLIINGTSPIKVGKDFQLRRTSGVENFKLGGALNIAKNSLCCFPMTLMGILGESRDKSNCKRDVRSSMCQVQQVPTNCQYKVGSTLGDVQLEVSVTLD